MSVGCPARGKQIVEKGEKTGRERNELSGLVRLECNLLKVEGGSSNTGGRKSMVKRLSAVRNAFHILLEPRN